MGVGQVAPALLGLSSSPYVTFRRLVHVVECNSNLFLPVAQQHRTVWVGICSVVLIWQCRELSSPLSTPTPYLITSEGLKPGNPWVRISVPISHPCNYTCHWVPVARPSGTVCTFMLGDVHPASWYHRQAEKPRVCLATLWEEHILCWTSLNMACCQQNVPAQYACAWNRSRHKEDHELIDPSKKILLPPAFQWLICDTSYPAFSVS